MRASSTPHTVERVHMKTVRLADQVSRAEVYRTGKHHYEADIRAEGGTYGTLRTDGRAAHAQSGGLRVTLHPDGGVTSRVERARPEPRPVAKRLLVATPTLADGVTTAKVYRLSADYCEADILANGVRLVALVADGHAARSVHNGLHLALQPDGRPTSRVDEDATPAS
jgi:hypothetical protein